MITSESNIQMHEELLSDPEILCTSIESASPFLLNEDLVFTKEGQNILPDKSCNISERFDFIDKTKAFFDNSLDEAKKRSIKIPNSPEILNNLASVYIRSNLIDEAISTVQRCLSIKKDFYPALTNLAECYTRKGEISKAIDIYIEISEKIGFNLNILTNLALLHIKTNDLDTALEYLLQASKLSKKNSSVFRNLGVIYLLKNNPSMAISYTRKALRINDKDFQNYNNLGVCYAVLRNIQKALIQFKTAYSINKNAKNVVHNLTQAYQQLELHEEAIVVLSNFLDNFSSEIELRKAYCLSLFKTSQFKRCIQELLKLEKVVDISNPTEGIQLYNNLAIVYWKLNKLAKANSYFQKCLEYDEDHSNIVIYNIIEFYFALKNFKVCKSVLDCFLEKNPNDAILNFYYGEYYFHIHEYRLGLESYYHALKLDPSIHKASLSISTIEIDVFGNFEQALKVLKNGMKYQPNDAGIRNNYAYCLIQLDRLKEARKVLDETDISNTVHLNATMGLLHLKEGNLEEGRKYYNKAAELAKYDNDLFNLANQKKQLEIGIYHINMNNIKEAEKNLKAGLKFKASQQYYRNKILEILEEVSTRPGSE